VAGAWLAWLAFAGQLAVLTALLVIVDRMGGDGDGAPP
jgi:hypothetical protein